MSTFLLKGVQTLGNGCGLSYILETPKNLYQKQYKKAVVHLTEGALRLAVSGLMASFVINQIDKHYVTLQNFFNYDQIPCEEYDSRGGFSYSSDNPYCSLAGRIGGLCYDLTDGYDPELTDGYGPKTVEAENRVTMNECVNRIFKFAAEEEGLLSLLARNARTLVRELKETCYLASMNRFDPEQQRSDYPKCIQAALSNAKLLKQFI